MLNISFVIYCEHPSAFAKVCELSRAYSAFFAQTLILFNLPSSMVGSDMLPASEAFGPRTQILSMPDRLHPGSALNKIFPHLLSTQVLLVDSRIHFRKNLMDLLKMILQWNLDRSDVVISFQPQMRCPKIHPVDRIGHSWKEDFQFVTTFAWGAMLFHSPFVLDIGAFHPLLSDDALCVDLSWRAQKSTGMILEVQEPISILSDSYYLSRNEWSFLRKNYPQIYPDWKSYLKKSCQWALSVLNTRKTLPVIEEHHEDSEEVMLN